jgi:acyl-CoA synthetase (AMP-forming)/AMP-acid ligase II
VYHLVKHNQNHRTGETPMGWIKSGARTIDAAEFEQRARKSAQVVQDFGVAKGDGIALYLRNDIAYFEAVFGAGMLGIYPVPVNWHYTPDEGPLSADRQRGEAAADPRRPL